MDASFLSLSRVHIFYVTSLERVTITSNSCVPMVSWSHCSAAVVSVITPWHTGLEWIHERLLPVLVYKGLRLPAIKAMEASKGRHGHRFPPRSIQHDIHPRLQHANTAIVIPIQAAFSDSSHHPWKLGALYAPLPVPLKWPTYSL